MDPDSFEITIDETNVLTHMDDIIIEEQLIDKNTVIRLNDEQIQNELTQLLFDSYQASLSSKVSSYLQLINSLQQPSFSYPLPSKIVDVTNYHYLMEGEEMDDAFAAENNVKPVAFTSFLRQLYTLLKHTDAYPQTKQRLDALFVPFLVKGTQTTEIGSTETAFTLNNDKTVPIKLLPKDVVNVSGYYVHNKPESTTFSTFHVDEFIKQAKLLQVDDQVRIVPKEFIWNVQGRILDVIDGKIFEDHEDRWIILDSHNERRVVLKDFSNGLIFKKGTTTYDPSSLVKDNVYYPYSSQFAKVVLPNDISQVLFFMRDRVQKAENFQHIEKHLYDIGYLPTQLPASVEKLVRKLVTKRYPTLQKHGNPVFSKYHKPSPILKDMKYEHEGKSFDSDLARYMSLHKDVMKEGEYVSHQLLRFLKKWEGEAQTRHKDMQLWQKRVEKELASMVLPSTETLCKQDKAIVVTKIYDNLEAMIKDTGKKIYFDEELDPTEYSMKVKVQDEDDLRTYVRSKHAGITKEDLDFEVDAILQGKRRVRNGDYAILRMMGEDVLYVRRKVAGSSMWIKLQKLAFQWCADQLYTQADLQENPCISYKKTCKELEDVRKRVQHEQLKEKHELLEDYLKYVDALPEIFASIEKDIQHFTYVQKLRRKLPVEMNSMVDGMQEKTDDVDEIMDGDMMADVDTKLVYQDLDHYAVLPQTSPMENTSGVEDSPAYEFIMTFTTFLGIQLSPEDLNYMIDWVDAKKSVDIKKELAKVEKKFVEKLQEQSKVLYAIYKNPKDNEEKFKQLNDVLQKRLREKELVLMSTLFQDVCLHSMAMLVVLIMSKYPEMMINNIYPSCVRFLSYKGYPIYEKDKQRSLLRYFACMIKHIISSNDPRYELLNKMTQEKIHDELVSKVDEILEVNYHLKLKIESNKFALDKSKKSTSPMQQSTWSGFKPNFDFEGNKSSSDPVVKLLSEMNRMAKDTSFLKKTMFSTPSILNACCMEPLTPSLNYYDFFKNNAVVHKHLQTLQNKMSKPNLGTLVLPLKTTSSTAKLVTNPVHFKHTTAVSVEEKETVLEDPVSMINDFVTMNPLYAQDEMMVSMSKKYPADNFWNDHLFSATIQGFNTLKSILTKYTDQFDEKTFMYLQNALIFMRELNHVTDVRNAMSAYFTSKLPRLIGKIIHKKKLTEEQTKLEDTNMEIQVLISFLRNKNYDVARMKDIFHAGWNKVHTLWFFHDDVKNVSAMTYVLIKFLFAILYTGVPEGYAIHDIQFDNESVLMKAFLSGKEETRAVLQLLGNLVQYILKDLHAHLVRNDPHIDSIKKRIEELREQRKQDLMSKYKVDDEERELQMALKKLGLKTWFDVGGVDEVEKDKYHDVNSSNVIIKDIMKQVNQKEENVNYDMSGYVGDNGDQDELDEDFASHDVFNPKDA